MRSHAGVAANAFRALAERGINIRAITTSESSSRSDRGPPSPSSRPDPAFALRARQIGQARMAATVSYAQRFEDIYLMRCFGERPEGFYIDMAPGTRSSTTSRSRSICAAGAASRSRPNPHLSRLPAVRPRDLHHQAVVGTARAGALLSGARLPRALDGDAAPAAQIRTRTRRCRRPVPAPISM